MWNIVLLLGVASYASAKIATIGPCTAKVEALKIDFDKYSSANHGVWFFSKITDTPNNAKNTPIKSVSKPTGTPGVYDLVIYSKKENGKPKIFANETVYGNQGSVIIAKGKDYDYTLKIYFLQYIPGEYAYYYICSDDGGDIKNDYRYVVSTNPLSSEANSAILALEKKLNFKGKLVDAFYQLHKDDDEE